MMKFKVFLAICKKFMPVFRHFFMEKFQDPAVWYEARLAYTKSVATNSIGLCLLSLPHMLVTFRFFVHLPLFV